MSIDLFHDSIAAIMREHGFEEYPFAAVYTMRSDGRFEAMVNVPSYHAGLPELPEHIGIKAATPESVLQGLGSRLSDLRRRMREFVQAGSQERE